MKKKLSRWTAVFTVLLLCMGLCSGLPVSAAYENTHINSGNPRVDIVEIAKSQIGYLEGSLEGTVKGNNNYTKYNVWNGRISGYGSDGYGYPWCHTFVSWCANQAGIGTDVIPRTAGTGTGRSFFVRQGTYQQSAANGGSYVPQAGDIIYYGSGSSPSHVGIVSGCNGSTVYAIEGNCSDMVTTRAIGLSDGYIIGYGVPNYKSVHPAPSLGVTPGNSSTETVFSWNGLDGVTRYDLKVWKNQVWDGDAYWVAWGASSPCSTVLPEGTYQAYVDACFGDDVQMSNVGEFTVKKGCRLEVQAGNSLTGTAFLWNTADDATRYDVKVWKDKIWEGDAYWIEWGASSPCSAVLPEGTYQAYVDACFGDDVAMSNVVTFYVAAALPGDLDGDSALTVTDAVLLQRYLLGADTLTQGQWQIADCNADGVVNGFDLALLRQKLVG